jgi:putative transcriptional regulator
LNFSFHSTSRAVPVDRPLEMLLAAFAAGTLEPALAALVGAHLEMRRDNRDFIANLETVGGILLEDSEPVPLSERDRRLSAIFSDRPCPPKHVPMRGDPVPLAVDGDALLPASLLAYVGHDFDALEWTEVMPGLQRCVIGTEHGIEASLVRCRAGKRLPGRDDRSPGPPGLEVTLVLQGGFSDALGHYLRGDIAVADEALDPRCVIDPNEEGIFFVVRDSGRRLGVPPASGV